MFTVADWKDCIVKFTQKDKWRRLSNKWRVRSLSKGYSQMKPRLLSSAACSMCYSNPDELDDRYKFLRAPNGGKTELDQVESGLGN